VIFKALVLQALYNLSDDQAEYQLRDRLSFMRFLGLGLEEAVPDAKTLWLYREVLAKAGAVEELCGLFDGFLKDKGYLAMGGQIIDATIVSAPKQHNSREENETIKGGKTPEDWQQKPAKNKLNSTSEETIVFHPARYSQRHHDARGMRGSETGPKRRGLSPALFQPILLGEPNPTFAVDDLHLSLRRSVADGPKHTTAA
jgi:Transposase domain (DUF772)